MGNLTSEFQDRSQRQSPRLSPAKIWTVNEPPFAGFQPVDTEGYKESNRETTIVIDNGTILEAVNYLLKAANLDARLVHCACGMVL